MAHARRELLFVRSLVPPTTPLLPCPSRTWLLGKVPRTAPRVSTVASHVSRPDLKRLGSKAGSSAARALSATGHITGVARCLWAARVGSGPTRALPLPRQNRDPWMFLVGWTASIFTSTSMIRPDADEGC